MRAFLSAPNQINVRELLDIIREDLNKLPEDIQGYANRIFLDADIRKFIIEANLRLLEQGLRPDLSYIEKIPQDNQKSNFYERGTIYARTEGVWGYEPSQTKVVDLYKTGFFYKSLEVRAGSNELLEFSTDPKSVKLGEVWGDILGISSEDVDLLITKIKPKIVRFVNERLTLKK